MAFWIPIAMAASGAAQGMKAQEKERRDRELQAATAAFSPWTGLAPKPVASEPGAMEGALAGFQGGMGMQQGFSDAASDRKLKEAMANHYAGMGGGTGSAPRYDYERHLSSLPQMEEPQGLGNFYSQTRYPRSR